MRKVELLPTRDCEAGYGPDKNVYKNREPPSEISKIGISALSPSVQPFRPHTYTKLSTPGFSFSFHPIPESIQLKSVNVFPQPYKDSHLAQIPLYQYYTLKTTGSKYWPFYGVDFI